MSTFERQGPVANRGQNWDRSSQVVTPPFPTGQAGVVRRAEAGKGEGTTWAKGRWTHEQRPGKVIWEARTVFPAQNCGIPEQWNSPLSLRHQVAHLSIWPGVRSLRERAGEPPCLALGCSFWNRHALNLGLPTLWLSYF